MAFRIQLVLVYTVLCLLSLYNANAFNAAKWPKKPRIVGFSWQDCGPAGDPAHITALTVAPEPVKIPGNITVSTSFNLANGSPTDVTLALTLEKKIAGFFIKVPCVDNVGSCTYENVCTDWADLCPKYFEKYGLPCACPIPAKTYTVSDVVVDVTSNLPPVITSGDFRITANIASPTAGHVFCLQLEVNVASG